MRKNVPRILAWLALAATVGVGPVATQLGRTLPADAWRWSATAAAALLIISFFWFPRRGEAAVATAKRRPARPAKADAAPAAEPGPRRRRKLAAGRDQRLATAAVPVKARSIRGSDR